MCERPNWSALLVYYGNRSKLYIVSARDQGARRRKRHTRRVRAGRDDGCRRPIAASAHRAAGHEGWMRIGAAREGARARALPRARGGPCGMRSSSLIGSYTRDTWPNKAKTQLYDRPLHVQHKAANRNLCVVVEASVREPQYVQSESVPHTKFVDS